MAKRQFKMITIESAGRFQFFKTYCFTRLPVGCTKPFHCAAYSIFGKSLVCCFLKTGSMIALTGNVDLNVTVSVTT